MFYVGQTVVATHNSHAFHYGKGDKFVIKAILEGCKDAPMIMDVGIPVTTPVVMHCPICRKRFPENVNWVDARYFRPSVQFKDYIQVSLKDIREVIPLGSAN